LGSVEVLRLLPAAFGALTCFCDESLLLQRTAIAAR
jgi:hypothetical protein